MNGRQRAARQHSWVRIMGRGYLMTTLAPTLQAKPKKCSNFILESNPKPKRRVEEPPKLGRDKLTSFLQTHRKKWKLANLPTRLLVQWTIYENHNLKTNISNPLGRGLD